MRTKDEILKEAQDHFGVTVSDNDGGITRRIEHHVMDLWAQEVAKNNIVQDAVSRSVPYQLCPKCGGDGDLLRYNSPALMARNVRPICDVCDGKKIIPMGGFVKPDVSSIT